MIIKKTKILLREENSHKKSFYDQLSLFGMPSHRIKPPTLNVETSTTHNIEYLEFTTAEMTSMMKEKRMNLQLKNDKLQYFPERTPSATNVQSPLYIHHSYIFDISIRL